MLPETIIKIIVNIDIEIVLLKIIRFFIGVVLNVDWFYTKLYILIIRIFILLYQKSSDYKTNLSCIIRKGFIII